MSTRKPWQIPPRRVVVWYAVSALPLAMVVLVGGYLSYHYHALSLQSRDRVERAYEVLDLVNGLFIAVEDAGVATRDFIITGDEADLAPVDAALRTAAPNQARLQQLVAANPEQLSRVTQWEASMAAELAVLTRTIALRRTGFEAARAAMAEDKGRRSMARLREQTGVIATAEHRLLMRRQEAGRIHERDTVLVGIGVAALSVAMRLLIAWGLARLRKRGRPLPSAP